jgi:hypothetical protein
MNPWEKGFSEEEALELSGIINENDFINKYIMGLGAENAEIPQKVKEMGRIIDERLAGLENEIIRKYLLNNFSSEIKKELFDLTTEIKSMRELLKAL